MGEINFQHVLVYSESFHSDLMVILIVTQTELEFVHSNCFMKTIDPSLAHVFCIDMNCDLTKVLSIRLAQCIVFQTFGDKSLLNKYRLLRNFDHLRIVS